MRNNAPVAEGGDFRDGLAERVARFDRDAAERNADRAEEERQRVLEEFPLEDRPKLELERYALGPAGYGGRRQSFCRLMEYGTNAFGSIRGGSAAKHIIYQHRTGEWRVPVALRGIGVRAAEDAAGPLREVIAKFAASVALQSTATGTAGTAP